MPKAHYLWIRPPPDGKTCPFGHDIAAIRRTAAACEPEVTLNFWCLESQVEHYRAVFADTANTQVRSIEAYLTVQAHSGEPEKAEAKTDDESTKTAHFAQRASKALKTLLEQSYADRPYEQNIIRDRVTAKELIAFFLLYREGGYVLDSNVRPAPSAEQITLIEYDKFGVPLLPDIDCTGKRAKDGWLMYSPQYSDQAEWALNCMLGRVEWLLTEMADDPDPDWYREASRPIFMYVINGIKEVTLIEADESYSLPALQLRKHYFNTHRLGSCPLIAALILLKDTSGLEDHLAYNNPITLAITLEGYLADASPLLMAILFGAETKIELLATHIDPSKASVSTVCWAALYKHHGLETAPKPVTEYFKEGTTVERLITAPAAITEQLPPRVQSATKITQQFYWTRAEERLSEWGFKTEETAAPSKRAFVM